MFFKVLAAIVTADAFDRHMRGQQHRARVAEEERRRATPGTLFAPPGFPASSSGRPPWNARAPERPT